MITTKILHLDASISKNSRTKELANYLISKLDGEVTYLKLANNGFAPLSLERLKNLMLRILENCSDVWCTKMNKLLFYIDFLAFRNCGMAISGLSYRAIEFGPVPDKWDRVYSEFQEIEQVFKPVGDFEGNLLTATQKADMSMFAEDEIKLIDMVCTRFGKCSARELSRISHEEKA